MPGYSTRKAGRTARQETLARKAVRRNKYAALDAL
jgi:hypothetical protein